MHLLMLIDKSLTKPNCYYRLTVAEMARPRRIAVEALEEVSILEEPEEEASNLEVMVLAYWIIEVILHLRSLDRIRLKKMIVQSSLLQKMMSWQAGLH